MSSVLKRAGWRAETALFDGYEASMRALGMERASDTGSAIVSRLGPLMRQHQIARRNMELVFPHANSGEIDALLGAMWDNLGRVAGELPLLGRMDVSGQGEQVRIEGLDILHELQRQQRPILLFGGHFANWEVLVGTVATQAPDCCLVYRHLNNPYIDARLRGRRASMGGHVFAPKGDAGARIILKSMQEARPVAMMVDQKMNDGIEAPFFGMPAMCASGGARMALRYDAAMIPMSIARSQGPNFIVRIHEPLARPVATERNAAVTETMTAMNRFIEERILATPAQWFWVHRRFAKDVYRKAEG
ncbi:lysophospholipid acyltransferase family protein [Glycocaulis sp.]|uniref:lysophospholipid acyltransferase family protein n=1 Tax=Glycocaulis sp. TaxID=1969725 RepID=UPI003D1D6368